MIDQLASRIWKHNQFHLEYEALIKLTAQKGLNIEDENDSLVDENTVTRLIQSAAVLASSGTPLFQAAAFRIAANSWTCFRDKYDNLAEPITLIFSRLGNFPSVALLSERLGHERPVTIKNIALRFETVIRRDQNTILLNDVPLLLTDFQMRLWSALESGRSVALSAPTSAGKSFVLYNYLVNRVARLDAFIGAYIVPTRALISQVTADLGQSLQTYGHHNVQVSQVPVMQPDSIIKKTIYVLTQERLQTLLHNDPTIAFDVLVADEAQSVQDGSRGVVFQDAIENVILRSGETQLVFAAPLAKNPEVFKTIFKIPRMISVSEESSPVSQNIVAVERVPKRQKLFRLTSMIDGRQQVIGDIAVSNSFNGKPRTLANLAYELGDGDANLIYYGAPSGCENIAAYIGEIIGEEVIERSSPVSDFAKFVEEHLHPKFPLVETLRKGVAFHYGKMPTPVRRGVESLFAGGDLTYIVATSTLLQGVNLPAKNIFLYDPRKGGDSSPLTSIEFWNLAGRAGRLKKDFEGNIYLIAHSSWIHDPLQDEMKEDISTSTSNYLVGKTDDFIQYVQDKDRGTGVDEGFQNVFVKLFIAAKKNRLREEIEHSAPKLDIDNIERVIEAISAAVTEVSLPIDVVSENMSVSPHRQQALSDYLYERAALTGLSSLMPLHPLATGAYERLEEIFQILWEQLELREDKMYRYLTLVSYGWMTGTSYRKIIDDAIAHNKEKKTGKSVSTIIRNVLGTINDDIRYRMVKLTKCYNSVLSRIARDEGDGIEHEAIPDIPLYLEVGASTKTMISLITLGLSRMTSGIVANRIQHKDWDVSRVRAWLRDNADSSGLPKVCREELETALIGRPRAT